MEHDRGIHRKTADLSARPLRAGAVNVSSTQPYGWGVQPKSLESTPATKAELWEKYQQAKQATQERANNRHPAPAPSKTLPIQAKLTIGESGDKYEQEADRVASQVVEQIHAPAAAQSTQGESVQRQDELAEEIQAKPSISHLQRSSLSPEVQREAMPEEEDIQAKSVLQREGIDEEDKLQMKSLADSIQRVEIDDEGELQMKSQVQCQEAIGGGEASTDLESSINSARGGGVAISNNIRQPMEQAFGADFSGVKVHTDGQSDQLNRSIQARAFTTGQDVFFRSGEYNPGSRGGQELLAHELTHVVQQNGGAVQRLHQQAADFTAISNHGITNPPEIQLYSAMEASELIENKYQPWKQWYYEVCVPAMQTIAVRTGQDFNQYLATKTQQQFKDEMIALHTEAKDERSWYEKLKQKSSSIDNSLVQSQEYEPMNRVSGTNILVNPRITNDDNDLKKFINLYRGGGMKWYRGLSISHFSYKQLATMGVLGSEGAADIPTFTMGNASPTRWLPGLYDPELADAIAHSVDQGDAGIRDIMTGKDIPIGVTVQYPITPPAHVAFLNDGEQVVRGPITSATVYRVILSGPAGYTYRLVNGSTNDLPPAAPYQAGVGSPAIVAWEALIDAWLLNHP